MTMDELFNAITQIIARPDTEITEEHKRKAIQILCCVDDYLLDEMDAYSSEYCEVDIAGYLAKIPYEIQGK